LATFYEIIMSDMLKIEDLSVFYGDYQAVKNISFEVGQGDLVTFIGANGAGKTSTIRAILGLVEDVKGRIWFEGRDMSRSPSHVRVEEGMRMIPEGRKIFPELTVAQNLRIGAYFIKDAARLENNRKWVYSLFPVLAQRENQLGRSLSGGEQQILAIARALMGEPKMLLIDEVSMGLMPIFVDRVFDLIKKIHSEGMTILLVEQNAKKALAVADRGYVLETGSITLQDRAANLEKNPLIISAYLGGN
jgi:branched-chain amino acid transport system ATP-binding protein